MGSFLPKAFRWIFTVLVALAAIAAFCILLVIAIDPKLPSDTHFGPIHGDVLGQSAEFALQPEPAAQGVTVITVHAFNGNLVMTIANPAALIALLKRYGLPMLLIYTLFLAVLFDLLRRLFRNVGRGDSFTPQSIRLVQLVGGLLIIFAVISTIGESLFTHAAFSFLMQHTDIAVSGTPVRLPQPSTHAVLPGHWLPFGRAAFWYGLLVLALAEVFRQGLVLKRDSELTV